MSLYDRDIRALIHAHLAPRKADGAIVLDEMGIYWGEVRCDVAAIDDRLSGWEIKSDHDSLARLPIQSMMYGYVFDDMTIAAGDKFVRRAADHVPDWWGIVRVTSAVETVRECRPNPCQDAFHLAALLWREELVTLLANADLDKGWRSKPKPTLCRRVADTMAVECARRDVLAAIRRRVGWPEEQRSKPRPSVAARATA